MGEGMPPRHSARYIYIFFRVSPTAHGSETDVMTGSRRIPALRLRPKMMQCTHSYVSHGDIERALVEDLGAKEPNRPNPACHLCGTHAVADSHEGLKG